MSNEPFDLEKVYDKEISPLMARIIKICKKHKMPMLATFCYGLGRNDGDPEGVDICTTTLPRDGWKPDEFNEALGVIRNGASTRPKMAAFTITTHTK